MFNKTILGRGMNMIDLKKPANIIYLSVIAIALIASLVLIIGYNADKKDAARQDATIVSEEPGPKEPKVLVTVNVETIEDGLKNMGTLITQEYYFTQVETYTKEMKVLNIIPSSSGFTYSYDGTVTAGIDFEGITMEKDDETKTITVTVPASQIQSVNVDTSTFKVYSEKDSLWNPMKITDYNVSLSEFENAAKEKALKSGILQKSDEQAKTLISNFIGNFPSASGYTIVFAEKGEMP